MFEEEIHQVIVENQLFKPSELIAIRDGNFAPIQPDLLQPVQVFPAVEVTGRLRVI